MILVRPRSQDSGNDMPSHTDRNQPLAPSPNTPDLPPEKTYGDSRLYPMPTRHSPELDDRKVRRLHHQACPHEKPVRLPGWQVRGRDLHRRRGRH